MTLKAQLTGWVTRVVLIPVLCILLPANVFLALWLLDRGWGALAYILIGLALLLSAAAAIVLVKVSMRRSRALLTELGEIIVAGDWVSRHAVGQSPLAHIDEEADFLLPGGRRGLADLLAPFEAWLRNLQPRAPIDSERFLGGSGEVQRDLQLAKDFQLTYLNRPYPRIPEVHVQGRLRLEFYHRYEPALALGGDFFDILTPAPDCAGVFIADVMGHGTRSALITSMLRTLLGDLQHQARNAPFFLTELNKQFCGMLKSLPSPLFASAYYFVPDTTGRVATYSSAGHPAPFMVRSHLRRVTRLDVPSPRGAALGLIPAESFTGGHVRLMPGDIFVFFTDGVYEAHSAHGEEFGVSRIEAILRQMVYRGAKEMVNGIMAAVQDFVGEEPVMDDICIVAVEVTDKAVASDTRA